jgi:fructose 1,6-bisphosphate aldolase/phosphatase
MKLTISAIKADVGSIGGHTQPTTKMLEVAQKELHDAVKKNLLIDGYSYHTGDDIALIMTHNKGTDHPEIHDFAWDTFKIITMYAQESGCYAAGQDLLVNAPSGNVRGAGPGVAEIEFEFTQKEPRAAESFLIFMADKCSPGAFNLPLFLSFADPMYCAGLMLPKLINGFSFKIIDMSQETSDPCIIETLKLNAPEDVYKIAALLRDNERFGISAIYSRTYENEQAVSASTDRLHAIAGKYVGKDDPIAIIRNQGIFPAPEEIISPFIKTHFVGGDSRGAHNMPIMPVPMNTATTGFYCLPIISCVGFSINSKGQFSAYHTDFFDNPAWDYVRLQAQKKAIAMRNQGWSGAAMMAKDELEYTGFKNTTDDLIQQFTQETVKRCKVTNKSRKK